MVLPSALVVLKSFLLPVVAYGFVRLLGGDNEACDYAFAYGLLPVASSVISIARSYAVDASLIMALNASLILGKVVGFVLLLLLAAVFQYGFSSIQMQVV